MSDTNQKPTEGELEILQVLWKEQPTTVRVVNEKLIQQKGEDVGYTTTLKQMQRMFDKGFVSRTLEGKTHIYSSVITEDETQNTLVNRLLTTAFGGSKLKLVMQALGGSNTSKEELEEIKKIIKNMENK